MKSSHNNNAKLSDQQRTMSIIKKSHKRKLCNIIESNNNDNNNSTMFDSNNNNISDADNNIRPYKRRRLNVNTQPNYLSFVAGLKIDLANDDNQNDGKQIVLHEIKKKFEDLFHKFCLFSSDIMMYASINTFTYLLHSVYY